MEKQTYFSYFCSVQHRLKVSPQATALFFLLLGEIVNGDSESCSVALSNARIRGTMHTSQAGLRKGRNELIAAGIITFSSTDNGRTLALYTLQSPEQWLLDVVDEPEAVKKTASAAETVGATAEFQEAAAAQLVSTSVETQILPVDPQKVEMATLASAPTVAKRLSRQPATMEDKLQSVSRALPGKGKKIKAVFRPKRKMAVSR